MKIRVQFYKTRRGDYGWRAISRNGRRVAVSGEGYKSLLKAQKMASKLFPLVFESQTDAWFTSQSA